jgi:hypothetical protein
VRSADRRVHPLDAATPCPRKVAVDAEFVVAALEPSARGHREAALFLGRLSGAGTLIFFTDLLELRLHDAELARRQLASTLVADRPRVDLPGTNQRRLTAVPAPEADLFDRWRALPRTAEMVHVELPDLITRAWPHMQRAGVDSTQAVHVAMVEEASADGLVTTDPTYGSVDETILPLFVPTDLTADARSRRP